MDEETIKELYRKDENGKYVYPLLERNAIYGSIGEPHNGLKDERIDNYEKEN